MDKDQHYLYAHLLYGAPSLHDNYPCYQMNLNMYLSEECTKQLIFLYQRWNYWNWQ